MLNLARELVIRIKALLAYLVLRLAMSLFDGCGILPANRFKRSAFLKLDKVL